MEETARYLITTADEKTWKFDRPVIFLGKWCRVFARRAIWENMDAVVASPYGLGLANKDADYAILCELERKLFPIFCELLNKHNFTEHSERFWKIVLGHWFRRIISVLINRVKTLEQSLKKYRISGTTVISSGYYALSTKDSFSAIWAFNDDCWNSALDGKVLTLLEEVDFPIDFVKKNRRNKSTNFSFDGNFHTETSKNKVFKKLRDYAYLLNIFTKERDLFIINSYLPIRKKIELEIACGQFPTFWATPRLSFEEKSDSLLREKLCNEFKSVAGNYIEKIITTLIFELLPICYLEGFKATEEIAKKQPWPKNPKLILTSNNFDTDEIFKVWAASKVEAGSKYFVGQHGNNYGTHRYINPSIEEETADKFLTWGWTDGIKSQTPAFILKNVGNKIKHNPQGALLLIETSLAFRISTWDGIFEFDKYFSEQKSFVNGLKDVARRNLVIRLKKTHEYSNWSDKEIWKDFDSFVNLNCSHGSIMDLISKSRLVVHSYDSTGILETLSQNIPTMAFWQNGFDHLRDSAKPYYQLLVDAGIVHLSPDSAAAKINEVWGDVLGWWRQDSVQDARKEFCDRYARISQQPVSELKQILLGDIS